jgi:hypothetical protein
LAFRDSSSPLRRGSTLDMFEIWGSC